VSVDGTFKLGDLRRWAASASIMVLAHGGIAAAMVHWRQPADSF
jgi:hypothetical protein